MNNNTVFIFKYLIGYNRKIMFNIIIQTIKNNIFFYFKVRNFIKMDS